MADIDLYNNLSQPVTKEDLKLGDERIGFTFTTGAASGTLADVKAVLVDGMPSDGGDIEVQLYTVSGAKVADLGLIDDQTLSDSTTPTDIPMTGTVNLLPNTAYSVVFTGSDISNAVLGSTATTSGTGVAQSETTMGGAPVRSNEHAIAEVVENTVCFCSGTRIQTVRGHIAVESLAVGDIAVTASGKHRPIRWLGHRTIDCRASRFVSNVLPVRVAAHAFGVGLPARDLYLSPGHPVLVGANADGEGGHLVPIMCLINGTSVRRATVESVTYWHVELDAQDILLAEGLPAESYLDWGDRSFFTEGSDHALQNPDFVVPGLAGRCRPVALNGPVVEAERRRLDGMFAMRLVAACDWASAEAAPGF